MTSTKKDLLRDALISTINSFSPEYFDQAEDSDYELSQLLDSIEEFEEEVDDYQRAEKEKYEIPMFEGTRDLLDRLRIRDNF